LAAVVYLIEKNRLPANTYADLKAAFDDPDHDHRGFETWALGQAPIG
jgi:hypothetical protein